MHSLDVSLIVTNAKIWTANVRQPHAEAFAVRDHRFYSVGSSAEILALRNKNTVVLDARGRRVVPGFNDAHVHFYWGGMDLTCISLRNVRGPTEFKNRIADFASKLQPGDWMLGGGWNPEGWNGAELPAHELIDEVTPSNPVFLSRSDAHSALANAVALRIAGVDRNTPDVPGGEIHRDTRGNPTGIFVDAAKGLIERAIPAPARQQIVERVLAAQAHAMRFGVTSVQDMGFLRVDESWADIVRVYQDLARQDKLRVRIRAHHRLPVWQLLAGTGVQAGFGNDKLKIGAVKSFSDGSLGSSTAWFFDPYSDQPDNCGGPSDEMSNQDSMFAMLKAADQAGLQLVTHAIGDRANHEVLRMYARLIAENGPRDRRPRIEHAQHLTGEDIARFAELRVIASVQPYHAIDDGQWAERRLGCARLGGTYALRSLLDAGVVLAFGTDWMVAPLDPIQTIYAAVTRQTLDGRHPDGWIPEERITVSEAVYGYTMGSAYAEGEEQMKGSIEPGKLADAVILSDDIFDCPAPEIRHAKVEATIFDGEVVYESADGRVGTGVSGNRDRL